MKYLLLPFYLIMFNTLYAQTEENQADEGSLKSQVNDIVVVFKMHVDIGYTN